MRIFLKCIPPTTTAQQQKRVTVVNGKPHFYTGDAMTAESDSWGWLLAKHVPKQPLDGPLKLRVKFVYPHKKSTSKIFRGCMWPKTTKPDCSNIIKAFEDALVKMYFVHDDAQFVMLAVEKWHGPDELVGIEVFLDSVP